MFITCNMIWFQNNDCISRQIRENEGHFMVYHANTELKTDEFKYQFLKLSNIKTHSITFVLAISEKENSHKKLHISINIHIFYVNNFFFVLETKYNLQFKQWEMKWKGEKQRKKTTDLRFKSAIVFSIIWFMCKSLSLSFSAQTKQKTSQSKKPSNKSIQIHAVV